MSGQERLFAALSGVDEMLLERSERRGRSRKNLWLGWGAALAACLTLAVLVWSALPRSPGVDREEPAKDPVSGPVEPVEPAEPVWPVPPAPTPGPDWLEAEGEFHYLQAGATDAEFPATRFRIWINREIYYSYEQNGVYIIRPRQEPEIPGEALPSCRLEISHLPDTTAKQAALLVQERLAGEYEQVEELLQPPNGWFKVGQGHAYLFASNGTEWNDAQREVWIQSDEEGGSFILESCYFLDATEGHGARFADMMALFSPEAMCPEGGAGTVTELREAGERLMEAVFADDLTGVSALLTADAEVNGYGQDVSGEVSIASMDCGMDYEGNTAVISVKHRLGGEDAYTFLTIELRREDGGQWRAYFIGLER